MEFLFILEPFANVLSGICITVLIIGGTLAVVFAVMCSVEENNTHLTRAIKNNKKSIKHWTIAVILTMVIASPLTQPFEIYKKILIYRGIESETTDKLVDNIDALLDLSKEKINSLSRKSVDTGIIPSADDD